MQWLHPMGVNRNIMKDATFSYYYHVYVYHYYIILQPDDSSMQCVFVFSMDGVSNGRNSKRGIELLDIQFQPEIGERDGLKEKSISYTPTV